MKAVVFEGERKVAVRDFPDPVLFDEQSAIVKVDQTSICGSDLHFYWGDFGDFSEVRPGHEFLGNVVAVGKDVTRLRVGDRVINMALYGCGHCGPCHELRPTGCMRGWVNFGTLREIPGGQAQLVEIPHADHVLRKLPNWISDDQAVLMTDVLPTGAFAARNASIAPGATVAVIGLGPIGLSAMANALTYSPTRVMAFDKLADRRDRAKELGSRSIRPNRRSAIGPGRRIDRRTRRRLRHRSRRKRRNPGRIHPKRKRAKDDDEQVASEKSCRSAVAHCSGRRASPRRCRRLRQRGGTPRRSTLRLVITSGPERRLASRARIQTTQGVTEPAHR